MGRRTSAALSGAAFSAGYTLSYGYNARNELTSASRGGSPAWSWSYAYDPIGNRTSSVTNLGAAENAAYTGNGLNQYSRLAITGGGAPVHQNVDHDTDGNLSQNWVVGELNCDGLLDASDKEPLTLALNDPVEYAIQYPGCNILNADIDGDAAGVLRQELAARAGAANRSYTCWIRTWGTGRVGPPAIHLPV